MSNINIEAYYDNIDIKLYEEILNAEKSIYLALAWITDEKLFNLLVNKSISGRVIKLFIRNDSMNRNSKINFQILSNGESQVFMIEGLHDKICILDHKTVITGSYNWTNNAKLNHENIQIIKNDFSLVNKYISEKFEYLSSLCKEDSVNFELTTPVNRILKRLLIIKNYVSFEINQKINLEISILSTINKGADLQNLKEFILKNNLKYSLLEIEKYDHYSELNTLPDRELIGLKNEVKELQKKLILLEKEKNDIEKMLTDFQFRHTSEVGEIILEILKCKKLKLKIEDLDYAEVEQNEEKYRRLFENKKKDKKYNISDLDKKTLKTLFRKASKLCHPDKIDSSYKELAHEIFNKLKIAYDNNDIYTITTIIEQLERGNLKVNDNEVVSEKNSIYFFLSELKNSINTLEQYISEIKLSEAYRSVIVIQDWDLYFMKLKNELMDELSNLYSDLKMSNN